MKSRGKKGKNERGGVPPVVMTSVYFARTCSSVIVHVRSFPNDPMQIRPAKFIELAQ